MGQEGSTKIVSIALLMKGSYNAPGGLYGTEIEFHPRAAGETILAALSAYPAHCNNPGFNWCPDIG